MTNLYIYCLFDLEGFVGVYSSLRAVHRDALKLANRGYSSVYMIYNNDQVCKPSLTRLRNTLKGECDVEVKYRTDNTAIRIYKTRLKE